MRLHSSLGKLLGPGALFGLLFAVTAAGCDGCDPGHVECDANGVCEVCDAYGCHPAETGSGGGWVGTTAATSSGEGGAGQGGAGQGGAGQGGAGGAPACDPAVTACPCDADSTCPDDKQCIDGLCVKGCDFSYECGPGKVCANGACVVGCDDQTPCSAGYTCDKGVCQPDPQNPQCSDQQPCDGGQICENGLCTTPCATNADCGAGQICDGATGSCIPDPSPTPGCGADKPCTGMGQVCEADGYCHYPCNDANQCKLIDSRFVACDQGICKTQEEVSPECTTDNPCPVGQDCISNKCL